MFQTTNQLSPACWQNNVLPSCKPHHQWLIMADRSRSLEHPGSLELVWDYILKASAELLNAGCPTWIYG